MTIGDLIRDYTKRLEKAGVYAPFEDAQALLAAALGVSFVHEFPLPWDRPVEERTRKTAEDYIQRRENREPLARILGETTFWGLKFQVTDKVFRPDPMTETLVENALIILEKRKKEPLRLLDLGMGSGCLLLALLSELPNATGTGVDSDERSVHIAEKNAEALGLAARASFLQSNWAEKVEGSFDFIISNPPSVRTCDMTRLDPEMREHERMESLRGGEDGLDALREIASDLDRLLASDGKALIRAHTWEREAALFKKEGFLNISVVCNYRRQPWGVVMGKKRKSFWKRLIGR